MTFPIDHLLTVTTEREAARAELMRLGFALTERGEHPGRGTSNHLMFFERCYWELLSIDELLPGNRSLLENGNALAGCALRTVDAERDAAGARAAGAQPQALETVTRPVRVGGDWRTARFTIAPLRLSTSVRAHFFFCQHVTPELVWSAPAQRHPNGAVRIKSLYVVGPEEETARAALGGLLGAGGGNEPLIRYVAREAFASRFGRAALCTGDSSERFAQKSGVWLGAIELQVRDLEDCRSLLTAHGVSPRREPGALVPECEALGHPLIFSD